MLWGGTWEHVLGTDQLGRDLLARIVDGARVSLLVGLSAVAISAIIGVTLGLIAGYRGGLIDTVITSIADIQIAFPGVLAGLILVTAFGPGVWLVIIVIAMSGWMVFTRVTRGFVFSLKTSLFVEAGELSGAKSARIMRVHLLPNLYSSLVTLAVLEFAAAVLSESAFSFLGFGVQPPGTSWGLIIAQGRDYITNAWWIVTFAGCAIALAVLGTNLIALWLQSFGDVRGRERTLLETPGSRSMTMQEQTVQEQTIGRVATMTRGSSSGKVHDRNERLLLVNNLTISFPTRDGVINGVDDMTLAVGSHERVGIVGESGSGKSVMGLAILGLVQPPGRITSGEILWKGENMLDPAVQSRVRGREIAMIFQDPMVSLNPLKTVGAQLREVLVKRAGVSRDRAKVRAAELLELVGISQTKDRLKQYPYELSGGMRQRVMIATALAGDPALLIADEPTTGLDVTIQDQILKLLKELSEELGVSILMITHDLGVVAEFCDRVQVMYGGRIVERSPIDACFATPSHPYTRGLLASVPRVDTTVETLIGIPGEPLDRAKLPRAARSLPGAARRWTAAGRRRRRCCARTSTAIGWRAGSVRLRKSSWPAHERGEQQLRGLRRPDHPGRATDRPLQAAGRQSNEDGPRARRLRSRGLPG